MDDLEKIRAWAVEQLANRSNDHFPWHADDADVAYDNGFRDALERVLEQIVDIVDERKKTV